ncbi:MAG: hypothetical protein QM346_09560, partial [Chloroflexota bacterium]|nr:hypothetical protein [Chloroflexota bacterium]
MTEAKPVFRRIFTRGGEQGSMYYTTHLRNYLDATSVEPRDRGIAVDRRFFLDDGEEGMPVEAVAVDDVISV